MRRKKPDSFFPSTLGGLFSEESSTGAPSPIFANITAPYLSVSSKLFEIFSLDARSLCVFRILLGFTLVYDILDRFPDLSAHYTDEGVHSRLTAMGEVPYYQTSLNFASGEKWFQAATFLITLIAGFFLVIGYYSKVSAAVCWFMISSIQARNQSILHCGDDLLRLLTFMAFFTPIQKLWSIDSFLKKWWSQEEQHPIQESLFDEAPETFQESDDDPKKNMKQREGQKSTMFLTMGGILLLTQVLITYATAFFHKSGEEWRVDGSATWYSLHLSYFARGPALILQNLPTICKLLTFSVLYWQFTGPVIYFSPFFTQWTKLLVGIGFFTMHVSFALCFRLDTFNWITIAASVVLIPPLFWDYILPLLRRPENRNRVLFVSYPANFLPIRFLVILYEVFGGTKIITRPFRTLEEIPSTSYTPTTTSSRFWLEVEAVGIKHQKGRDASGVLMALKYSPWLWPLANALSAKSLSRILAIYFWGWRFSPLLGPDPALQSCNRRYKQAAKRTWPRRGLRYLTNLFLGFALMLILVTNYYDVLAKEEPSLTKSPLYFLRLEQSWHMFSPSPPDSDFWYQIQLTLKDKTVIDVFADGVLYDLARNSTPLQNPRDRGANAPKPEVITGIRNHRWFKFFENGLNDEAENGDHDPMRHEFAGWICRMYNGAHRVKTKYISIYLCTEGFDASRPSSPPRRLPRQLIYEFECA